MIKDLESDCITCSLFIEIYITIQHVLSRILFDWIERITILRENINKYNSDNQKIYIYR